MFTEDRYTEVAQLLSQYNARLAGRASNPFHYPDSQCCIACGTNAPHHMDGCPAARAMEIMREIRFIGQWTVNDRITNVFAVMGKRNVEAGALFFYNVNAVVTNNSLRPHTTCSCGHCKPTELCDHAQRVGVLLQYMGKILKHEMPTGAPVTMAMATTGAVNLVTDQAEPGMPEDRPIDDDFVPGENLSPERLAQLQHIVGNGTTAQAPYDASGNCGKCGGNWGHVAGCVWE
jgi:hypothetical protein